MHSLQTPATDGPKPALGYAPRRPAVIGFLRRHIRLTLLLLVAASALWWAPFVWHRAQVLYWQQRCANYTAPPDAAIASRTSVFDVPDPTSRPTILSLLPTPNVPKEWIRFYELVSPPGLISDGTLFLHAMKRPGGRTVLVAVDLAPPPVLFFSVTPPLGVQIRAFDPGRGARRPVQVQDEFTPLFYEPLEAYRIYAGQVDPGDPTHFTIKYELGDATHVMDGWVREHGVVLEARNEPSQSPPTSAAKSP